MPVSRMLCRKMRSGWPIKVSESCYILACGERVPIWLSVFFCGELGWRGAACGGE